MDWTENAVAELTALWNEGYSAAEIGRRMKTSKHSVVNKTHRLNLTPRPSPIKRDGMPPKRKRAPKPIPAPPTIAATEKITAPDPFFQPLASHPCRWPMWGNTKPTNIFCDAPSMAGKPYCEKHCKVAYITVQRRDPAPLKW